MTRRSRSHPRRAAVLLLVAGAIFVATPVVAAAQTANDGSDAAAIGFYDVSAEATGIGASIGDPSTQPYPLAAGLVPNAVAELGAGPSGHALASMVWPGPLGGNAGSLANVVGTPLPPEVVSNANDPVKAEAAATGGERDEKTLGPMSAVVNGDNVEAKTALADFAAPGLISAARVVTKSRSYGDGNKVAAVAESELQGVEVAGQLAIDSIHTVAKGSTDGNTATTEPTVVVSGVSVNGQKATIDEKGLHIAGNDQANPLDAAVAGVNQGLSGLKMTAFVTKPVVQKTSAGSASLTTGAVIVQWDVGGGQRAVAVLGGGSVNLTATTGSSLGTSDLSATPSLPASPTAPSSGLPPASSTSADVAPALVPSALPSSDGSGSIAPATGTRRGTTSSPVLLDLTPAGTFSDRVPGGWMVIGLLGMAFLGSGLHKLRLAAIDVAGTASRCPLEGAQT